MRHGGNTSALTLVPDVNLVPVDLHVLVLLVHSGGILNLVRRRTLSLVPKFRYLN
eukprot:SAG31_NODE_2941_length_4879_cov_80.338075_1_plen_55_part_00